MPAAWTLEELTELDAHLRGGSDGATMGEAACSRERSDALRIWLARVRNLYPGPSARAALAVRSERMLRVAWVIFALLSGAATAAGLLAMDSGRPVNVGFFLGSLVGLQVLWLAVRAGLALLPRRRDSLLLPQLLRGITESPALPAWRARLFCDANLAGIFFNLGAIIATLALLLARDLAFGWESTLLNEASRVHRLVQTLSTPWGRLGTPTLADIDGSRILRLHGAPQVNPRAAAAWWPFLIGCLVVYGLLPRILLALAGCIQLRLRLRHGPPPTAAVERLYLSLTRPPLRFDTLDTPPDAHPRPDPAGLPALTPSEALRLEDPEGLLDAPARERLARRLPFPLTSEDRAGRVVLVEAWRPPLEQNLRDLREMRRRIGPERDLLVLAVGLPHPDPEKLFRTPEARHLAVWRERLAALGDPRLGLLPWEEPA